MRGLALVPTPKHKLGSSAPPSPSLREPLHCQNRQISPGYQAILAKVCAIASVGHLPSESSLLCLTTQPPMTT
jgi:hypothetical protein